jgi:hypothetical protein
MAGQRVERSVEKRVVVLVGWKAVQWVAVKAVPRAVSRADSMVVEWVERKDMQRVGQKAAWKEV